MIRYFEFARLVADRDQPLPPRAALNHPATSSPVPAPAPVHEAAVPAAADMREGRGTPDVMASAGSGAGSGLSTSAATATPTPRRAGAGVGAGASGGALEPEILTGISQAVYSTRLSFPLPSRTAQPAPPSRLAAGPCCTHEACISSTPATAACGRHSETASSGVPGHGGYRGHTRHRRRRSVQGARASRLNHHHRTGTTPNRAALLSRFGCASRLRQEGAPRVVFVRW
jgi:hypothetical protein